MRESYGMPPAPRSPILFFLLVLLAAPGRREPTFFATILLLLSHPSSLTSARSLCLRARFLPRLIADIQCGFGGVPNTPLISQFSLGDADVRTKAKLTCSSGNLIRPSVRVYPAKRTGRRGRSPGDISAYLYLNHSRTWHRPIFIGPATRTSSELSSLHKSNETFLRPPRGGCVLYILASLRRTCKRRLA